MSSIQNQTWELMVSVLVSTYVVNSVSNIMGLSAVYLEKTKVRLFISLLKWFNKILTFLTLVRHHLLKIPYILVNNWSPLPPIKMFLLLTQSQSKRKWYIRSKIAALSKLQLFIMKNKVIVNKNIFIFNKNITISNQMDLSH